MTTGGRNLVLLGVASILITSLMTGVSLAIYHNSGDIYLDRSRPGDILEEYLEKLKAELDTIDSYKEPFNVEALSDERLGIIE